MAELDDNDPQQKTKRYMRKHFDFNAFYDIGKVMIKKILSW